MRTLSELTTSLTKAGLDPSRIQARAEALKATAKAKALAGAKRKRDEDAEHLGEQLKLPPWLEERRGEIEEVLAPLRVPGKEEA